MRPDQEKLYTDRVDGGLTLTLIGNLRSTVKEYGSPDSGMPPVLVFDSGDIGLGYRLIIQASTDDQNRNLIVCKSDYAAKGFEGVPTNEGLIIWDLEMSSQEALKAILKVNEMAKVGTLKPIKH